jgi:hypothetical protein
MHIGKRFAVATALALLAGSSGWGQYPTPPGGYPGEAVPAYPVTAPPPFTPQFGPPAVNFFGPPPPGFQEFAGPGPYEPLPPGAMLPLGEMLPETPPGEISETVLPAPELVEYGFFDPGYWFPTDGWSNSFEIGVNGSTGNAETLSMRTGAHIQRKAGAADYTLDFKYAKTLANGTETQHNALVNSNIETTLGDSLWTTFWKTSLEYDEFKAWDVRVAMNAGVGYHLLKTDEAKLIARFGSGVSREVGGPADDYVPEAVYGLEFNRKINRRQKFYGTIEYFPDWTDYRDYRLVTNAGWELVLDEESNLSLKLGAIDRYDSTPHGRKPNDLDYSLVLLWKQ